MLYYPMDPDYLYENNPSIPSNLAPLFQEYHLPALELTQHAAVVIERTLL